MWWTGDTGNSKVSIQQLDIKKANYFPMHKGSASEVSEQA